MMEKRVLIIAEAGVNHNGEIEKAFQLVDAAVDAGVDYVKFQTFKAETIVSPKAKKAAYQERNIGDGDDSQFNMLKKLELSDADHQQLMQYAKDKGIAFFSTAFDVDGVQYLNQLGLDRFKVPSGEITNYPYLRAIAQMGKPIILSTGMASLGEIEAALTVLTTFGAKLDNITVLLCNTEYPTPMEDVNLTAMRSIAAAFDVQVGYSDHTLGIEVPIAAVALGAKVIEKHFTLDRTLPGPDHKASLEPSELREMVRAIRNIELAISGNAIKAPSESELKNVAVARKSIHLRVDIPKGTRIDESLLVMKRPGDGISPMDIDAVIGRVINRDLTADDKLLWEHLEQ